MNNIISRNISVNPFYNFILIFFSLIFILCPITILNSANKVTKDIKNTTKVIDKDATVNTTAENNSASQDAPSQDTLYNYEKPAVEEESYIWLVFKTIIILAALVCAFYFFYRFVTKKTGIQALGRDVINVLSIVPIGQNKFLQVVDIAGRILVIGVSESSINVIAEIKEKDEIDRIRLLSSKSSPVKPGGFQDYVSKYISRLFGKGNQNKDFEMRYESDADNLDYLKKQKERLKKLNGEE